LRLKQIDKLYVFGALHFCNNFSLSIYNFCDHKTDKIENKIITKSMAKLAIEMRIVSICDNPSHHSPGWTIVKEEEAISRLEDYCITLLPILMQLKIPAPPPSELFQLRHASTRMDAPAAVVLGLCSWGRPA
jgi:hypothetical protein